jgi:hypothetical protein
MTFQVATITTKAENSFPRLVEKATSSGGQERGWRYTTWKNLI